MRQVLYFDKTRMEMNNPANGLVTNGLLVTEMTTGNLQVGDNAFIKRKPAYDIPVAGDQLNNVGPTFASFSKVINLSPSQAGNNRGLSSPASLNLAPPQNDRTGQPVDDTIDKDGNVGKTTDTFTETLKYIHYDPVLKHNIPNVFWDFLNQKGTIYQDGQLIPNQPVFGTDPAQPWLGATGYPIADAYWSKTTVGGVVKDVLIQPYQRRILTYTPSNKPPFDVEAGNVANQYDTWTDPANNFKYTLRVSSQKVGASTVNTSAV